MVSTKKPRVLFSVEKFLPYSFASATPPAVMAKVASFSGMSGLERRR